MNLLLQLFFFSSEPCYFRPRPFGFSSCLCSFCSPSFRLSTGFAVCSGLLMPSVFCPLPLGFLLSPMGSLLMLLLGCLFKDSFLFGELFGPELCKRPLNLLRNLDHCQVLIDLTHLGQ
ncbi:MAG: hypothetical protein ACKOPT_12785 [Cyanobium sp.]